MVHQYGSNNSHELTKIIMFCPMVKRCLLFMFGIESDDCYMMVATMFES
jgi:hypothetical protein